MVMKCVFCGEKSQQGIRSLHTFPKCLEQQICWVENMRLHNFVPTKNSTLCSDHFEKDCFQTGGNNVKLKPGSNPTLFSTYKSACAYCKVQKKDRDRNRSFHKFPLQDEALLSSWLTRMGIEGFVPNKRSILCSDHFDKSCFLRRGDLRLKSDAVPTIFVFKAPKEEKRPHPPTHAIALKYIKTEVKSRKSLHLEDCSPASTFIEEKIVYMPTISNNTAVSITEDIPEDTQNSVNKSAQRRDDASSLNAIQHDHRYETTPQVSERKLKLLHCKVKMMKASLKNKEKVICRLRKKVSTLKDVVSKLRKTKALPESNLPCIESIADSDASLILQSFEKNIKRRKRQ